MPKQDSSGPFSNKRQFATTHWTMVCAVGGENKREAATALQQLCQIYWYPLYIYVRSQGHDADEAADLTQAFFADLLEREDLKRVDPSLGKFRSFLLKAIKHFLLNHWNKQKTIKRGGGKSPLSLDFREADSRYLLEPQHTSTPDVIFQKQWAQTLLLRVEKDLQSEFEDRGKASSLRNSSHFLREKMLRKRLPMLRNSFP